MTRVGAICVRATCLVVLALLPAAGAVGQAPRDRPFDGKWSLEFFAATRPGGETLHAGALTISPQNLQFEASRGDFRVDVDGKFSWTEGTSGQWRQDATVTDSLGQRSYPSQSNEPILKATGRVDRQRKLTLTLEWTAGNGWFVAGDGVSTGTLSVPADGSQVTVFFKGHSSQAPSRLLTSEWTLSPESVRREEISPGSIRETVTYSARRQRTLGEFGAGPLPVVERIRVQQVRQLKLVERG
jgi:hypothetical protein